MIVIDFEVFKYDWLCVAYDLVKKEETIIVNDREQFIDFYDAHKNDLFVGYNIRGYDQFIAKAILCGFNPKEVNDFIIVKKRKGHEFSKTFNRVPFTIFDVMQTKQGLKTLEGFMGQDIRESSVPFSIDRKLTPDELDEVISYCKHDVFQTLLVFKETREELTSQLELVKMFDMPRADLGKTKAQLSATILNAENKVSRKDDFKFVIPSNLQLKKYKFVVDWFLERQKETEQLSKHLGLYDAMTIMYKKNLECDIAGVPHVFAWGGIHGAIPKYHSDGYFINVDVASYYPSLMIHRNYHSRNIKNPDKFTEIYNDRLEYKKQKDKRANPLKIVLNSTYGAMKDRYNPLYDPLMANNVCVTGQLYLLMLIEMLEDSFDIIQSNTDGILVKLRASNDEEADREYEKLDDICREWETRTKMVLEFDEFSRVAQKDVNNYLIIKSDKSYKSVGAYVKKLNVLDNDLPIVNKALINFFIHNIPVEETINNATNLIDFQKIVKISNKYLYGIKNATFRIEDSINAKGKKVKKTLWNNDGERLNDKVFRVFASKLNSDGGIYKFKGDGINPQKFANTPDNCFIDNSKVAGVTIPNHLDREWYINLAKKRIREFGKV